MNIVAFNGRLTSDPTQTMEQIGNEQVPVTSFSVAINDWVNGKQITTFIPLKVYREYGISCMKNLYKGRPVGVEGELRETVNHYLYVRVNKISYLDKFNPPAQNQEQEAANTDMSEEDALGL